MCTKARNENEINIRIILLPNKGEQFKVKCTYRYTVIATGKIMSSLSFMRYVQSN